MNSKHMKTTNTGNKYGLEKWATFMILFFLFHSPNPQLICLYQECQIWTLKENDDNIEERCFIPVCNIMTALYIRSIPEERFRKQVWWETKSSTMDGLYFYLIFGCNTHAPLLVFSINAIFPSTENCAGYFTYHIKVDV